MINYSHINELDIRLFEFLNSDLYSSSYGPFTLKSAAQPGQVSSAMSGQLSWIGLCMTFNFGMS